MISRGAVCGISLCVGLLAGTLVRAELPPPVTINPNVNGNMAAAQNLIAQAYNFVTAAQNANNYDMMGHAVHVKVLLTQASRELQLCANIANAQRR